MRDFLPADVRKREYVIGIIKQVYESYGFEPLETPAVENLETLTGKYGEEGGQLMYKILKRGEKLDVSAGEKGLSDLALRYDLTVPLARVVANYQNDLPKFFKRYQIQPVWRADRPAKGRYREFYQCDVDAVGSKSLIVEVELISAVSEILQRLGFSYSFGVVINHREVLRGILDAVEIKEEKQIDALVALDKLDKIGTDGVFDELVARGIGENAATKLLRLFASLELKSNADILSLLADFMGEHKTGNDGLKDLAQILKYTNYENILIDASLARGLSYYTGTIMEISVPDLAGSLAGGGRYDGLIGMFGKEEIPACGISLGLERILAVMDERKMFPANLLGAAADVLVTVWNEESIGESLKLAQELRAGGLRVLVYPEADKLGKQFKYASQVGVSYVCVLGETELAENKVTLKNMRSGEQETVARGRTSEMIKKL